MAWTDWSNSTPADHTKLNTGPSGVRAVKSLISERLDDIFYGFTAGEVEGNQGIKNLPFVVQGSDPGATADKIKLYAKDVLAKAEIHVQDEDGDVIQLTTGGKINAAALGGVYAAPSALSDLVNLLPYIYPVGTVLTFGVSTNPATLLGFGTWTAIAGKVIVGINAADSEFDTLDETGGAKTHTLTTAETPLHNHLTTNTSATGAAFGTGASTAGTSAAGESTAAAHETSDTGGGGAHNNLQPYIVKYVWQRTA